MLRISKLADYATLLLSVMATGTQKTYTANGLAARSGLNPPTASKLLKQLTRAGLVCSHRGTNGGYSLARPASEISAIHIIEAVEGRTALTECAIASGLCELEASCQLSSQWQRLSAAVRLALSAISLAQLNGPPLAPQINFPSPHLAATPVKEQAHGHA